ncbi:MAG: hypothetical protein LBE35_03150 [Clostridiales bacterium]|jgi:hypothetical protein|nr:hypothetical protein [Clostridiales bacterium]
MFNIWKFKDVDKVKITTIRGAVHNGVIISMVDKEDYEDIGADNPDDTISIENVDGIYTLRASEIANIEIIPETTYAEPDMPRQAAA